MEEQAKDTQPVSLGGSLTPFKIVVRGGLHDGTSMALAEGTYEISADPGSAICLQDSALEKARTLVLFKARAALVQPMDVGENIQLQKLPCRFALGEASLEVTSESGSWLVDIPRPLMFAAPILIVIGVFAVVLAGGDQWEFDAPSDDVDTGRSLVGSYVDESKMLTDTSPGSERINNKKLSMGQISQSLEGFEPLIDPVEALSERLRELGLNDRLNIDLAEGSLRIRGTLDQGAADQLNDVQAWYDANYGGALVAQWDVSLDQRPMLPPMSIESIWFTGRSHIIANGGQKYFEGSTVGDGWTVLTINAEKIVLNKHGKELVIELNSLRQHQEGARS